MNTGTVTSRPGPDEWDLDRIRRLVTQNDLERGRTEYKRELGNGRATLEAVAALANTFGGVVLVGVDETKRGLDRLTGVEAGGRDELARRCWDQLVPPFSPEIIPIKLEKRDRYVLVVLVDPDHARRPVMLTQGNKVLVRLNGHNVTADWYRLRDLFAEQQASSPRTSLPADTDAAAAASALGASLASLGVRVFPPIDASGHPSAPARAGEEHQTAQPATPQAASPGAITYPPIDASGHPSAPARAGEEHEEHQAAQPVPGPRQVTWPATEQDHDVITGGGTDSRGGEGKHLASQEASLAEMSYPPVDTSGHPSPPIRTGEEHQAAQPASAQEASPTAMAQWVDEQQFSTTGRRRGYDDEEVDAFLDEIRDTFLGKRTPPLTTDEVQNIQFSISKRRGYEDREVDAFLDEVEMKLAAWRPPTA